MLSLRCLLASLVILSLSAVTHAADKPALIRTAQSGPWSAAATWEGGKLPVVGDRVQVRTGHSVVYDVKSEQVIRSIHVGGTLSFARDKDTRLDVGLIKIQAGDDASEDGFDCDAHIADVDPSKPRPALEVGSPEKPIDAKHTALIRLVYIDGMDKQSCPAIVCCGGRMDFHGAPMSRTWVKLGKNAKGGGIPPGRSDFFDKEKGSKETAQKEKPAKKVGDGDTEIVLAEPVTGWRVGDGIIITATTRDERFAGAPGKKKPYPNGRPTFTEETVIKSINGTKLVMVEPLWFNHLGEGDYRAEVANLSRNVVVESADPAKERGHTMYHRRSAGAISYAEFRHLGKEGVLGRYSLHYHLVGDTMRGSYVIGASIWDSGNRWLTIHGTNYLVVRDCVGYRSVGHGFFLEDGTEVYNVLDRNLAVQAIRGKKLPKQVLPFDHNEGAGYWWANSLNSFTRNVSCESGLYGYRFEATRTSSFNLTLNIQQPDGTRKPTDIRTLPFVRFEDNEAHSDGLYGFNLGEGVDRAGPDIRHPFIIRGMKIWDIHYAFRPQAPSVLVENMTIHRAAYGVYHPNYDNHVYRNLTIRETDTEPFNRGHDDLSAQHGLLAVDGLTFTGNRMSGMPLIQISDDNPTGKAESHFKNVKVVDRKDNNRRALVNLGGGPRPTPTTPKGVPIYLHDYYGEGRHAKVVSSRAKDLIADGNKYREDVPLTGDESRVTEVRDVPFPQLLDPVDDLPPVTVITHVTRSSDGKVKVRGTTSDNGTVTKVLVNGKEAKALAGNFGEWEITLDDAQGDVKLSAQATDSAGNVEKRPHELTLRR